MHLMERSCSHWLPLKRSQQWAAMLPPTGCLSDWTAAATGWVPVSSLVIFGAEDLPVIGEMTESVDIPATEGQAEPGAPETSAQPETSDDVVPDETSVDETEAVRHAD